MASLFVNKSPKLAFIILALVTASIGAGTGVMMNTYFKNDNKVGNKHIAKINDELILKDFAKEQEAEYPWLLNGNFTLSIKGIIGEGETARYFETDNLVKYDIEKKTFIFNSISSGEMVFTSTFDSSVNFKTTYQTSFYSRDVEKVVDEQFNHLFSDGYLDENDLKTIQSIDIDNYVSFDAFDLKYMSELKAINIHNDEVVTTLTNFVLGNKTKIYVPASKYEEYIATQQYTKMKDIIFTPKSSLEKASVMLFKNGGQIIDSSDSDFEYYQIDIGQTFLDIPNEDNTVLDGNYFTGWKDINGNIYDKNTPIEGDIKLYASWKEKIYRVKFHEDENTVTTVEYKYMNDLVFPKPVSTPNDLVFQGWAVNINSQTVDYLPEVDSIASFFDKDYEATYGEDLTVHYYAVWVYRTFNINVYVDDTLLTVINCAYNDHIYFPNSVPGHEGTLYGFSPVSGGQNVDYLFGECADIAYVPNEHGNIYIVKTDTSTNVINYYAVFTKENYKLVYNLLSGKTYEQEYFNDDDVTTGKLYHNSNNSITFKDVHSFPVPESDLSGHHFVGWSFVYLDVTYLFTNQASYQNSNYEVIHLNDNVLNKNFDSLIDGGKGSATDIELNPYFEQNSLRYEYSSPTGTCDVTAKEVYFNDSQYSWSGSISRPGYSFTSFSYVVNANQFQVTKGIIYTSTIREIYFNAFQNSAIARHTDFYYEGKKAITFNPIWSEDRYDVVFFNGTVQYSKATNLRYGTKINKPNTDPNRTGYYFSGWGIDGKVVSFPYTVYGNTVLEAIWIQEFTVTFMRTETDVFTTVTQPKGSSVNKPSGTPSSGNNKQTFDGWYYLSGQAVTFPFTLTGDVTIYPHYSGGGGKTCVGKGTLVTLADGTVKAIEDIQLDDKLLCWDAFTGQFVASEIILYNYGTSWHQIITCTFDNGQSIEVLNAHCFFDLTENKYVNIYEYTAYDYIGDEFYFTTGPSKLVSVDIREEDNVEFYEILTAHTINFITNDMIGGAGEVTYLLNLVPFTGDMTYDLEILAQMIEEYGLLDYETVQDLGSWEMFDALNAQYIYVILANNNVTMDYIYSVVQIYYECRGRL